MMSTDFKIPGKYRRAFDWRVSHGDPESRKQQIPAMVRLASSDYPDILEDFLDISRKRRLNRTALAKLQIHMLEELIFQETAVKHYRQKVKDLEEGKTLAPSDEERKRGIELCNRELFFYRLYANAIRAIGDGIAWRSLEYDRAVTHLMSERATKQTVVAEGTVQELREWSLQFDSGAGLAILNALTNCLAIGDVTVIRDDGSVEIIEVKASNAKSGRKLRQKHKMNEVVTLLETGAGQADEKQVTIQVLPLTPETGLPRLGELLATAGERGWAASKISNCLYVEVFDFRKLEAFELAESEVDRTKVAAIGEWSERGDFVCDMNSLDIVAFSPNCAPFSVFPFDNRTCVELLVGAKCYITYLNINAVAREFEFRGWKIEKTSEALFQEGNREATLAVCKGPFHAKVPPADFARLQFELVRVKSIIDTYELLYRQGPTVEHGYSLSLLSGEPEVWN